MNEGKNLTGSYGKIKPAIKAAVKTPWLWLIMLFPAGLLLSAAADNIEGAADLYCNTIYRAVSIVWNNISGLIPFSLGEIIILILPFAVLAYIIVSVVIIVRSKGNRLKKTLMAFVRLIAAASVIFFLFVVNCGINYSCSSFSEQSGFVAREASAKELYQVCVYLADEASQARSMLGVGESEPIRVDASSVRYAAREAVNALHQKYSAVSDGYSAPKSVMLSRGMSYLNITGIFFPYTFEANVNTDANDFSLPFTMCHELAHVRGFMNEADANFIAFLACVRTDVPLMRYSGCMSALKYLMNHLYSADTELYESFAGHFSRGMLTDLQAQSEYWKQFETPVAAAASSINDSYLKINRQQEGVRSYGRVADLIIAYYFDEIASVNS